MRRLFVMILCIALFACDIEGRSEHTAKDLEQDIAFMSTVDGVEISQGEISQVFASKEARSRFVAYLDAKGIYYRLNERYLLEVSWIPSSDEHRRYITREAFGIPQNQLQKTFVDEIEYQKYKSILDNMQIEYFGKAFSDGYVILWTPEDGSEVDRVNLLYGK